MRWFSIGGMNALRSVRRAPGFAAPACFTLALAVGMAIAISSIVDVVSIIPSSFSTPLRLDPVRDPGWGVAWSSGLLGEADAQAAALDTVLLALALAATATLAIAVLTLINLQLSRTSERALEQAVRWALGGSRLRRMKRLAVEGAWLGGIGTGLGLMLGFSAGWALRLTWPHELAANGGALDPVTVMLGIVLPTVAMIVLPVAAGMATDVRTSFPGLLRTGGRALARSGSGLSRDGFAVAQLAASLSLLVGAGLLLRAPAGPATGGYVDYATRDTLVVKLDLGADDFADPARRAAYYRRLMAEVSRLPGIADTTLSSPGALLGAGPAGRAQSACGNCVRGGVYVPVLPAVVRYHAVSPEFFSRRAIPVLEGREFGEADGPGSARVAVVSAGFAASHFEGGRAVGKEVQLGGATGPWYRIVGVVADVESPGLTGAGDRIPALYLPLLQAPPLSVDLAVHVPSDLSDLVPAVEGAARGDGNRVRVAGTVLLGEELARRSAPLRWLGWVLALVGGVSLLIAVQGLASVMRYQVRRRKRELAIRSSVGASPRRLVWLVLRRTLTIAAVGTIVGLWASLPLVGWSERLVREGGSLDPRMIGAIVVALLAATVLGAAIPAWNAARMDPSASLRED